ncbi:hypothetical protein WJR50_18795 [Catalinimonas sp. 4WD22]|uniref:hypothetical protein n=1 Tax=Catalinimonas locisalis TaxID=3133978 RepID=UPI003101A80B
MSVQTEQQLVNRATEIKTATEQYSITEQQVGQLLIDIINTAFYNIPDALTPAQVKALLLQNPDTNNLSDQFVSVLNNVPGNTNYVLSTKENVGIAQSLVDGLKDGVVFSGNTLNKLYTLISGLTTGLNTKVSTGDTRLTDERTPKDLSVSTDKIQNSAVNEIKLSSEVRDKLNQVSGATGYNSASFDADFAGKDSDDLQQGNTNLFFTTAEKTKLSGIESGATRDQSASEIESLYESRPDTNKYSDTDKGKVDNLPSNTITSLSGKENVGVAQNLIDNLKDSVPTSGDTLHKLYILLSGISAGLNTKVSTGDTRLSDQRTPINNSVSTAKIQDSAVTNDKIASGITQDKLSTTVQNTLNSVAGKENVGVAQTLIDNIKDSVPASGDTLNKIAVNLDQKVDDGDSRLSNERTPTDNSVSTAKIADSAVTNDKIANSTIEEVKLSSAVRDKLNAVSGATGYDSSSFNADFSGKTSDDLAEGVSNLYLTNDSVDTAKIQDESVTKAKLSTALQNQIDNLSGATGYNSSDFDTDFSGKTSDDLTQGNTNLYLTTGERSKLVNVPTNTIDELSTKASTGDSRFSDERIPTDDSVSTVKIQDNSVTNSKILDGEIAKAKLIQSLQDSIDSISLKENAGVAQSLIDSLKGGVAISGNTLQKLNALIEQNTQDIGNKENTGVAQTLIDNLKDSVPTSGDTLNKLYTLISGNTEGLSTKVDDSDSRLSDERTPLSGSVTTDKIVDSAVTEVKLANDLRIKIDQVSGDLDGGNAFSNDTFVVDAGYASG